MNMEVTEYHGDKPLPQIAQLPRPSLSDLNPREMIAAATEMATALDDIIRKQKLYNDINGKKYIKVEAWATLGVMLNVFPREVEVKELEDGSYEASVELFNARTGAVVGRGSALCGKDEARWGKADRYARRSMAVTRATGKAFRLGFAWIPALAGYEATPSEEMPHPLFDDHSRRSLSQLLEALGVPRELWGDVGAACKELDPRDWVGAILASRTKP